MRDQYKLGTREWLEGSNRAAFAQTLERMLDAARLKYWKPDKVTQRELIQAYNDSLKATGLRDSNVAVQRFAAAQGDARASSSQTVAAKQAQTVPAEQVKNEDVNVVRTEPQKIIKGLKLEPQALDAKTAAPLVGSLALLWAFVFLLGLGAWLQRRRWQHAIISN